MPGNKKHFLLLSGAGILSLAVYILLNFIGHWGVHFKLYLALFGLLFLLYLAGIYLVRKTGSKAALWPTIILAAGFYISIVSIKPYLSNDIYRYLWEGKIQQYGFNPFGTPPNAPEMTCLRDQYYNNLYGEPWTAIYPPLAQLVFRLFTTIHYSVTGFKALLGIFFLGSIFFLVRVLQARRLDPGLVLVFAWNPLVIIETAGMGHLDIMGVCLLLGALTFLHQKKQLLSAGFLAGAVMVKFLPAVFLPFFWQRMGRKKLLFILAFVGGIIVVYLPFLGAGTGLVRSLGMYTAKWAFNGLCYRLVMGVVCFRWIYLGLAGLGLAGLVYCLYRSGKELETSLFLLSAYILLVSPVLFPWYLVWLVPFCIFYRSFPLILFTGLSNISYYIVAAYVAKGVWAEQPFPLLMEYGVFGAVFVVYYRKEIGKLLAAIRGRIKGDQPLTG